MPRQMQSPPGAQTVIDGREYLYFAGTGYLGLHGHPEVIEAACAAARTYGLGCATSRTAFGNQPPTLDVERQAASWLGAEQALYLPSGYLSSQALLGTIGTGYGVIYIDELAHYSLRDAVRLADCPVHDFAHRSADHLAEQIARSTRPGRRVLVVSDGVFPVLGTVAPVGEYTDVLARYPGSAILLDDAHAIGVLGASGRGTWEWAGQPASHVNGDDRSQDGTALFSCATLSKACGGYGGIVAGAGPLIERLQSSRSCYGGATPLPAPVAAATAKALQIVATQPELRDRLRANAQHLREGLRSMGLAVEDEPTPIVCLQLDDARQMQHVQQELMQRGIAIAYFASYSGVGSAGALRIAVFATHTSEMIDRLVDQMRRLV